MPAMIVMRMIVVMMMIVVMIMVTMRVIVMRMIMMIVMAMAVTVVAVLVTGLAMAAEIGAAFRIEWGLDLDDPRAEPFDHVLDHMIAPDAQVPAGELNRQMTVAEMPGDSDQEMRVVAANLEQGFGGGDDLDQPAVLEHQRVAAPQHYNLRQVEQELKSARARHHHPAAVPIVEFEHDAVSGGFAPCRGGPDGCRTQHDRAYLLTSAGVMISIACGPIIIGAMNSFQATT